MEGRVEMVRLKKLSLFAFGVVGALVAAGSAFAADQPPAYSGREGNVQQQVNGVKGASNTLGSLPFTGLDLALIVGGALLLVIAGVALRRVTANRTPA